MVRLYPFFGESRINISDLDFRSKPMLRSVRNILIGTSEKWTAPPEHGRMKDTAADGYNRNTAGKRPVA